MNKALPLLALLFLVQPRIGFSACSVSTPAGTVAESSSNHDQLFCGAPAPIKQDIARPRRTLTPEEIEKAMRISLGPDAHDAQIHILDFDRTPVPAGAIQFPVSGAVIPEAAEPRKPFIWRGTVSGDLGNDVPCWARVQVIVSRKVVRTTVRLLAGTILDRSELEAVQTDACPLITPKDQDISDYAGLVAKRAMASLNILTRDEVETAPLVRRGSTVRVTAIAGLAHISLEGEAHSDGRMGQGIQVTNAQTGRTFFATVNGEGSVLVNLSGPTRL